MTSSLMEYYSQSGESIPLIIVSVHTEDRWAEFVAKSSEKDKGSQADLLSEHLRVEVIPFIESKFRTETYRLGIGHSLGGSFLLYEVFKEKALFDGIVAVSPNMTFNEEQLVKIGTNFIEKHPERTPYLYVTVGNVWEMENMFRESIQKFDTIVKNNKNHHLNWNFKVLENENHMTTFMKTYDNALIDFSRRWLISDASLQQLPNHASEMENALKNLIQEQSRFTKKQIDFSSEKLVVLAKRLSEMEEFDLAALVYEVALKSLATENDKKKEVKEKMEKSQRYAQFFGICKNAEKAYLEKNYTLSSQLYDTAFAMEVKNGTHMQRMYAVRSYAQTKEIDKAFEQLDLLANYFELQGNGFFIDNPVMDVLKSDKRWEKMMSKLEKNKKKAEN
jgi:tetratricopeptide (TPR) repeat protein